MDNACEKMRMSCLLPVLFDFIVLHTVAFSKRRGDNLDDSELGFWAALGLWVILRRLANSQGLE